jgi:ketosteroid isomerase-like protein
MKVVYVSILLFISFSAFSQSTDETEIRTVLATQTDSWNKGDIDGFMKTYWHNDSLMFIGKNGIKWGWQTTLDNYKKNYPDTISMGKLDFNILLVKRLSPEYYYVVGKWHLKRSIGDLGGHYDLMFRKIEGRWVIIADHSS